MTRIVLRGPVLTSLSGFILANLCGFQKARCGLRPGRAEATPLRRQDALTNLAGSILKEILIVAAWVLVFGWAQMAVAQAPHGGGHVGGGARMGVPPRPPISPPRGFVGPRGPGLRRMGFGPGGFGFRPGPIHIFRRRAFFGAPFFRFGVGLGFNSLWWPTCGPSLGWAWGGGYDCYPTPFYGYSFENYVTPQIYESPVYVYGGDERDLIWLYLKDGTVYVVTDYWLVNGQMHFSMVEDDPTKPAEHAIPYNELDVQKTIYVNTHRGFRIVFRDEPWQQYLKDHPDLTPTDVPPPQTN
jgi:hypothetical protein